MELVKYYPRSQTIHIGDNVGFTLCGKTAQFEVHTNNRDRLGMVNCKDCRAIYMENLKAERDGIVPAVSLEGESLAGLLQALALTAAGHYGYRKAMGIVLEAVLDGSS